MTVPYTATTARTQVRSILNEASALFWSNTEIDNWIQLACGDISSKTHCVEATYGLSLQDGVHEYTSSSTAASAPNSNETDVTIATATPGTLTSGGLADWITDGFKHGMRVTLSQTASNEGDFTILSVPTQDSITLVETTAAEAEGTVDLDYTYTWIDDITKIYGCVYHKGDFVTGDMSYRGLIKIHPRALQHYNELVDGEPYYWYHFGDTIGVYPVPDATQAKDCVLVYHSKVTEDIATLPDMYQALAIYYAVAQARRKEDNIAEAIQWESMYMNSLMFHREDIYNKGLDSKDMFQLQDKFQPPAQRV